MIPLIHLKHPFLVKNDLVIYDNLCYIDKFYDNPLFATTNEMHDNEESCLESSYDKALDDGPILLDDKIIMLLKVGLIPLFLRWTEIMCL